MNCRCGHEDKVHSSWSHRDATFCADCYFIKFESYKSNLSASKWKAIEDYATHEFAVDSLPNGLF